MMDFAAGSSRRYYPEDRAMPQKPTADYSDRQVKKTPRNITAMSRAAAFRATYLTVTEAADRMKLAAATIRKYCQCKCFTNTINVGGEHLIPIEDLDWWKHNRKGRVGRPANNS